MPLHRCKPCCLQPHGWLGGCSASCGSPPAGGPPTQKTTSCRPRTDTKRALPPQEIGILKSISYDRNIVQFYGAVLTERPMLVLEYMEVCFQIQMCNHISLRTNVATARNLCRSYECLLGPGCCSAAECDRPSGAEASRRSSRLRRSHDKGHRKTQGHCRRDPAGQPC